LKKNLAHELSVGMSRDKHPESRFLYRGESRGSLEITASNLTVRVRVQLRWVMAASLLALASIVAALVR
jgi:hypothetical protein